MFRCTLSGTVSLPQVALLIKLSLFTQFTHNNDFENLKTTRKIFARIQFLTVSQHFLKFFRSGSKSLETIFALFTLLCRAKAANSPNVSLIELCSRRLRDDIICHIFIVLDFKEFFCLLRPVDETWLNLKKVEKPSVVASFFRSLWRSTNLDYSLTYVHAHTRSLRQHLSLSSSFT